MSLRDHALVRLIRLSRYPAEALGLAMYALDGRRRGIMAEELRKILPDAEARRINSIIRRSYANHFHRYLDNLFMHRLTADVVRELVRIEGIENLDMALSRGRGAILLLAHFGSNIMNAIAIAFAGYKLSQLAAPPSGGRLKALLFRRKRALNERLPLKFFRLDEAIIAIVRALKRNEAVVLAFDGRHGERFSKIRMFGRDAYVAQGSIKMSVISGAPILPTFIVRGADCTQTVFIEPPHEVQPAASEDETAALNLQALCGVFERYIIAHPDHYGVPLASMRMRHEAGIIEHSLLS